MYTLAMVLNILSHHIPSILCTAYITVQGQVTGILCMSTFSLCGWKYIPVLCVLVKSTEKTGVLCLKVACLCCLRTKMVNEEAFNSLSG